MASPQWKVYSEQGEYVAACKEATDAAILVGIGYSQGGTIRWEHRQIVWREGAEEQSAGDSYDFCADTIVRRVAEIHQRSYDRRTAAQAKFAADRAAGRA